jgi:hypothetical protein
MKATAMKAFLLVGFALSLCVAVNAVDNSGALSAASGRAQSASYLIDSVLGDIGGISSAASPSVLAKQGFVAFFYDAASLALVSSPSMLDEGGTAQLAGSAILDDSTVTALSGSDIRWAVLSIASPQIPSSVYVLSPTNIQWTVIGGSMVSLDTNGLVRAGNVYTNTTVLVSGQFLDASNALALTVVDIIPDDFGSYAGDGLPDWWQIKYFGFNNPRGGPGVDANGDGYNNAFEYTSGLDPTTNAPGFYLRIENVAAHPTRKSLIFGPTAPGRVYTVQFATNLPSSGFTTFVGGLTNTNANERTVTDLGPMLARKLYRVGISFGPIVLLSPQYGGTGFSFSFETLAGLNYFVEYSDSLANNAWQPLRTVLGNGQVQAVTDADGANHGRRFYRVRR